jgi:ABC-type lipoprotein release transport system permease subunit
MLLHHLRYSARSLARTPLLTAALLATVAIGAGTHATVSAFVNGLVASNPAWSPGQDVVGVYWRDEGGRFAAVPRASYEALSARTDVFETLAAFRESHAGVTVDRRQSWVALVRATPALWDLLPLPREALAAAAASTSVVVSDRFWRNALEGRPDVTGHEIVVDGRALVIAAVAPDWLDGVYLGRSIDVWVPALPADGASNVEVLARVRGGRIGDAQRAATDRNAAGPAPVVMPFRGIEPEVQVKLEELRRLLALAAALVFVTAAANVSGFLLSRATRRSHETAARVALGATPARLASQIAADSLVISRAGGALGALVAYWTASALPAFLYPEDAARLQLAPRIGPILSTASAYTAIMLLCALAPLAQVRKIGAMTVLRRGDGVGMPIGRLRTALAIAQMGVCVLLVIGAALVMQGFRDAVRTVRAASLGQPVIAVLESAARYGRPDKGFEYFRQAQRVVDDVPGVGQTTLVGSLPGGRPSALTFRIEPAADAVKDVQIRTLVPDGKGLFALDIKAGRGFGGGDGPGSCPVALVSRKAADLYFAGDAVGRSMRDAGDRRVDIVGIAEPKSAKTPDEDPVVYLYSRQLTGAAATGAVPWGYRIRPSAPAGPAVDLDINIVSPAYFSAVGAPIITGTGFESATPDGCAVAIVNREAAQEYFNGSAVGSGLIEFDGHRVEIAGVVDAGPLRVLQRRSGPMVYLPWGQRYAPRMTLMAITPYATPERVAAITTRVNGVAGAGREPIVTTLEEHLARTALAPERIAAVLVGCSAIVALALSLLGVYGVISDTVLQRKREIALRLALGARAGRIVGGVLRHGLRIAAAGGAGGLAAAWIAVRLVLHAHPDFHTPSLWMWAACPVVLLGLVAVATIAPARWALAVDPMTIAREG